MLCRVQQRGDGYGGGAAAAAAAVAAAAQSLLAVIGSQERLLDACPHLARARLGRVKPAIARWETPRRLRCAGPIGAILPTSSVLQRSADGRSTVLPLHGRRRVLRWRLSGFKRACSYCTHI